MSPYGHQSKDKGEGDQLKFSLDEGGGKHTYVLQRLTNPSQGRTRPTSLNCPQAECP